MEIDVIHILIVEIVATCWIGEIPVNIAIEDDIRNVVLQQGLVRAQSIVEIKPLQLFLYIAIRLPEIQNLLSLVRLQGG